MAPAAAGGLESIDAATLNNFVASLTPQQIGQTRWNIENNGRISLKNFEVSSIVALYTKNH